MKCLKLFCVLLLLSLVQVSSHAMLPRQITCAAPSEVAAHTAVLMFIDTVTDPLTAIEVRGAVASARPRNHGSASWSLGWDDAELTLKFDFSGYADGIHDRYATLQIGRHGRTYDVSRSVDAEGGFNSICVEWADDSTATVSVGNKVLHPVATTTLPHPGNSIYVKTMQPLELQEVILETAAPNSEPQMSQWTDPEELKAYLRASTDPVEGLYGYLDLETNTAMARPGGSYKLALVSDPRGGYHIIYIAGAKVGGSLWQLGALKGHLTPTRFIGQYELTWRDATGAELTHDCHATLESGALLKVEFPLLEASMRFVKQPL